MFHATFMTILECFIHTLQHYYTFSGTNLLTRCRSASCCFLLFLVSEILVRKNILGIGRNQRPGSYFSTKLPEDRRDNEVGPRGGQTTGRRGPGPGRAALWSGPLVTPPDLPFRLHIAFVANTPVPRATIRKTFQRCRRRQSHLGGFRRSPPAPCRRGESSPEGLYIIMPASGLMRE